MKKLLIALTAILVECSTLYAQRFTDNLDRGLVAVPLGDVNNPIGTLVSWRRLPNEYFGVTYNLYLYYNGSSTLLASGLTTTNYNHAHNITGTEQYQVAAVVNGQEQEKCALTNAWTHFSYYKPSSGRVAAGYLDITLATVYDRTGVDVTANYSPNDAEFADLDGDGQLEMIIKRLNTVDAAGVSTGTYLTDKNGNQRELINIYPQNSTQFVVLDAYDINWQTGAATLLWRIDCGPNMVSSNSTEINIIAYDWDEDGKAEVVLRGADNMIVYQCSNGAITRSYRIGSEANTRSVWYNCTLNAKKEFADISSMAYTNTGNEYLLYMNGETGALFQQMEYPLKRLETGETDLNAAWGDGYGHRSSKYFMGAPFLDGRRASLFLGRGIYTRHKMMAMDLDRSSNTWSTRWSWACSNSSSPWYGNGYHNYIIADVDEDGRDEIVYGSMVIDDNGKGLNTTGFEHGDAQHVSDFDPWRKGLEFFGCLEDGPYYGFNYRNATTGEVYYKHTSTGDDGRAIAGNFSNDYPGSLGRSSSWIGLMSLTTDELIPDLADVITTNSNGKQVATNSFIAWGDCNFRIYWDDDLCSEVQDAAGSENGYLTVIKPGVGRFFNFTGTQSNNSTKHNSCFQGDLIGDWREEVVGRVDANTVRVYTTGIYSSYSFPSLWFDHQYRQAMVWQMHAYNQPPHLSFFLGESEGYTMAPPPLSMQGRTEIANNDTIDHNHSGTEIIACETNDMSIVVSDGAAPSVFYDNAPSWVQGTDVNGTSGTKVKTDGSVGVTNLPSINRTYYTHTLTGGAFSGEMHLVKQGDGVLVLPNVTEAHTGRTDIWAGTVNFNGSFAGSPVWMNRFTTFNTSGGRFYGGLTMEYEARLNVGGATTGTISSVTVSNLKLNYGARVVLDVESMSDAALNDQLNVTGNLTIDKKTWDNGPKYSAPVFEFNATSSLAKGRYPIGLVQGSLTGTLSDVVIEGSMVPSGAYLEIDGESKVLYLVVSNDLPMLQAPTIALTDMTSTDGGFYYYPTVSITDNNTGTTTSLSGTFTDLAGNTSSLSGAIYSEDFEGSSTASDYWQNNNGGIYSPSYTNSDGQCIGIVSSADRGDYITINADYSAYNQYTIEFDAYFNNASKTTDFAVMSNSHAASWIYNWGYHWLTTSNYDHNPYLFYMQRGEGSTTFTINETENATLSNATWYHFTLTVDASNASSNPTVSYSISPKGDTSTITTSGTYTLLDGEDFGCAGFYIRNGRYNYEPGGAGIDNINIYTSLSNSYTFTEPGTLTLTASADGYSSASATYEVPNPYAIYYESPAYNEILKENVHSVLGDKWSATGLTDNWSYNTQGWNRMSYWSSTNSQYGGNYQFVPRSTNNDNYVDNDSVLSVSDNRNLFVVEGFGIGHNSTSDLTFSATDLGDETTIIYYKVDDSAGGNTNYNEGYTYANADGSWSFDVYQNHTFCKLIAWVPVDEEYNELAETAPTGSGLGNVTMRRTFSSISNGSGWNTLVVPFDMSDRQILTTFGPGTQVAQFMGSTANTLIFNADTRVVHANEPVLIRVGDVHNNNFYVFEGVTRNVGTPTKSSDYYDFIGSYLNSGTVTFPANSYFYNINNGNVLNRVAENNHITFKGYRGYFSAKAGAGVKQLVITFEDADALGIDVVELQQKPVDVYTVSGLLIRRNATTLDGLPRGLYIVGKKKVVIN